MKYVKLNDGIAEVLISPSLGASVLAYNVLIGDQCRPIFRENLQADNVLDSCNFPLVPFSNRIKNGMFNWQGEQIRLPLNMLPEKHAIHGHGWRASWDIIEKNDTSVLMQYHHKADQWPFSYLVKQRISLQQGELKIELFLKNTGLKTMPAGLGLHPYFTRTKQSCLITDVDEMWAVDDECLPTNIINAPADLSSIKGMSINENSLDNALIGFKQEAKVDWPEWGMQAKISTSNNCKFLVVYSPENEDFFCVEPVTHCTDAINLYNCGKQDTGLYQLKPDEEFAMWMKIDPKLNN